MKKNNEQRDIPAYSSENKGFSLHTYNFKISTLLDRISGQWQIVDTDFQRQVSREHVAEMHERQTQLMDQYGIVIFVNPLILFADEQNLLPGEFLVLDGQHRLCLFQKYPEKYQKYYINVTIINRKINGPSFKEMFNIFHQQMQMDQYVLEFGDRPPLKNQLDQLNKFLQTKFQDQFTKPKNIVHRLYQFDKNTFMTDFGNLSNHYSELLRKLPVSTLVELFDFCNTVWFKDWSKTTSKSNKGADKKINESIIKWCQTKFNQQPSKSNFCFYRLGAKSSEEDEWFKESFIETWIEERVQQTQSI